MPLVELKIPRILHASETCTSRSDIYCKICRSRCNWCQYWLHPESLSDDDDAAGDDESDCVSDGDGHGCVSESGRVSENASENETDDADDGDDGEAYG